MASCFRWRVATAARTSGVVPSDPKIITRSATAISGLMEFHSTDGWAFFMRAQEFSANARVARHASVLDSNTMLIAWNSDERTNKHRIPTTNVTIVEEIPQSSTMDWANSRSMVSTFESGDSPEKFVQIPLHLIGTLLAFGVGRFNAPKIAAKLLMLFGERSNHAD